MEQGSGGREGRETERGGGGRETSFQNEFIFIGLGVGAEACISFLGFYLNPLQCIHSFLLG